MEALAPRHRRKRNGMPAQVAEPVLRAEPELLQRPEEGRIGTAEQRDESDLLAARLQLLRQIECDRAAGAKTGDDAGALRLEGKHLFREVTGDLPDAGKRRAAPIQPGGLQSE